MKRIQRTAALLFLLAVLPATAMADEVGKHIQRGIDQLYNVAFDDAAKSFDQAIKADPGDPRGHFFRANVHLWSYIFDQRQDQLVRYMAASDRAIAAAEKRLSANSRDNTAKMVLGMAYGYRAISNARAENFMAAALSAKTCYDRLNEVVKADPKMYDAYLGLGIFHFILGSVPDVGQFLAGMGGVKGDAALGLREIETAASKASLFRNDAQLILALLNIYYRNDLKKGLSGLEGLVKRYPRNVALLYAIGSAYLDQNQPDKAVGYFDRVAQQGNNDFKVFTNMSYGRAGAAFFMKNDFTRAKTYLQKFLRLSEEKSLRSYSWYLLGLSYEMEGSRANAVKAYDRAIKSEVEHHSPQDQFARRRARIYLKKPLVEADKLVIRALNAATSSDFNGAMTQGNALLTRSDVTASHRAQALYVLGQAYQGRGDYRKAIDNFTKAAAVRGNTESWVAPYSTFHIAECWEKLGDRTKWREYIERAKKFHDYDNESVLRFKIGRDVTKID